MPWSLTPRHRARTAPDARRNLRPARRPAPHPAPSSTAPRTAASPETPASPDPPTSHCLSDYYQPQAPHPGRHAAEPAHMPGSRNVTRQLEDAGRTDVVVGLDGPVLADEAGQVVRGG